MADIIKNLEITALVHGGRGIGRHEGKAIFVPLTAPGDHVDCKVVKAKRRYAEAEVIELVTPSPLRREPPCPLFGTCGGCQWQHLPYQEQTRFKEQNFVDLMVRSKLVEVEHLKPIVPAPDEWMYRNRIQLKCHVSKDRLVVGFYRHGTHIVVDVDQCRLVSPSVQLALDALRNELKDVPRPDCISQVDIGCGDDDGVRLVFHVLPKGRQEIRTWLLKFSSRHGFNSCIQTGQGDSVEVVHGQGDLTVLVDQPEMALRYGPGGFVQVNSVQNRAMVDNMLALLDLQGDEEILDLFCGMGNFSLPLALRAGRLTGVESSSLSIEKARVNAAANKITNVEFYAADVASMISRYSSSEKLDIVVLDPPRTGNYQAATQLLEMNPERILYVSCDPATLVRDLAPLVDGGYKIVSSQPFDLFPQTWHVESMTLLQKC